MYVSARRLPASSAWKCLCEEFNISYYIVGTSFHFLYFQFIQFIIIIYMFSLLIHMGYSTSKRVGSDLSPSEIYVLF